ncbi:hypothetical protein [Tenacibaculum piscium]|uniref:hypothetical protein n=1 Tax=Tenacibaculum piscium TaxID=1458515 RepID=UPI001F3345A8|nr:hypothetical protein [Tenacibaculum piscium]
MNAGKKIKLQEKDESNWYPIRINTLENHFGILICKNEHLPHSKVYPIRKNIAYSLQYIEFLNKIRTDIYMTDVLLTQNIKSILVHGATIIEAIFYYLIETNELSNTTNWIKVKSVNTGEYELAEKVIKNEIVIFEKTEDEIKTSMTFDQMSKKVEKKKLLGIKFKNYSRINALRKLRNKIHIHDTEHNFDTDWNNFNYKELILICDILHSIITSELFKNSTINNRFDFLKIEKSE